MQDSLVALFEMGHYASVACQLAGIAERTFYNWMERGEAAKSGKFMQFVQAIKTADAFAEARRLETIQAAGDDPKSWQAAAWWLERRHPSRYGRRTEVSGPKGGPIPVRTVVYDFSKMTDAQLDAFIAKAEREPSE